MNTTLRIGHLKIIDHLILGIAAANASKTKTFITRSRIETIAMNSWDQVCDALTDGDISGAFITSPLAMDLFAKGLDIRILMFVHRSGSVIVKKKQPGKNTLADFKGRTLLVPSKLCIQNMLAHRFLSTAGLRLGPHDQIQTDVFCEPVNPFLMTQMMSEDEDNDIAGFAVADPFGSEAVSRGIAEIVCTTDSLWKNHPCCVFVLRADFIQNHPDTVGQILDLFVQAGLLLETQKNDTLLSLAAEFLSQKEEIIRQALKETNVCFDPCLLAPDTGALNMIQGYMADVMGVLKTKIDVNLLVDNSFIANTLSGNRP
jgi:NitT/TauT family transport system substrate-binding protein